MVRRFSAVALAALALTLLFAASAVAATASFDGRVFRLRTQPGQSMPPMWKFDPFPYPQNKGVVPTHFDVGFQVTVEVGSPCESSQPPDGGTLVRCALGSLPLAQLRYRFSLGDGDDSVAGTSWFEGGVIYAGAGNDRVWQLDRASGGPGDDDLDGVRLGGSGDDLDGVRLYGGRGNDSLRASFEPATPNRLHGGPGNDQLEGHGLTYGGPGDDDIYGYGARGMYVGGRGSDRVLLNADGGERDVVRLRGGGDDTLTCFGPQGAEDVLFIDASDHVGRGCGGAHVLFTGAPRGLRP